MSEYQVDLLDYWRGRISARKLTVYITQLKPGARLHMAMGGGGAWSQEAAATHVQGQRVMTAVIAAAGGKKNQIPPPLEPPEEGHLAAAREKQERQAVKAANWAKRNRRADN